MGVVRFEFRTGRDGIAVRVRVVAAVRGGTGTARRVDAEDDFTILTGVLSVEFELEFRLLLYYYCIVDSIDSL